MIFSITLITTSIKAKVERWDIEIIDLIIASIEDVKDFVNIKLYLYTIEEMSDYNL
jgi:hypothetical protein